MSCLKSTTYWISLFHILHVKYRIKRPNSLSFFFIILADHSRASLRLILSPQLRGRGLWKFNCSLLKDLTYLSLVKDVMQETIISYACPIYPDRYIKNKDARKDIQLTVRKELFIETLLMIIRSRTITYSIRKTKERVETENQMLLELQSLESLSSPPSEDITEICKKKTIRIASTSTQC